MSFYTHAAQDCGSRRESPRLAAHSAPRMLLHASSASRWHRQLSVGIHRQLSIGITCAPPLSSRAKCAAMRRALLAHRLATLLSQTLQCGPRCCAPTAPDWRAAYQRPHTDRAHLRSTRARCQLHLLARCSRPLLLALLESQATHRSQTLHFQQDKTPTYVDTQMRARVRAAPTHMSSVKNLGDLDMLIQTSAHWSRKCY